MQNHYVHYVKRKVRMRYRKDERHYFYSQEQQVDEGFEIPKYHVTKQISGPPSRIAIGDIIWLFSVLKSPWGCTPPSLDGKLKIDSIKKTKDGYFEYLGNAESRWYMLNNATLALQKLKSINNNNVIKPIMTKGLSIGQSLQGIRALQNPECLIDYSDLVQKSKFDFISYRIKDGTKRAFLKVLKLLNEGNIVFWDRYSLPRRLAERREYVSNEKLDSYLLKKLADSKQVWGIESRKYAESGSYSFKEYEEAIRLNKYSAV